MGDWLMENGDRSFHSGDFAYDTDNDAWVPIGDSAGSTPVWWRKHGDGPSSYSLSAAFSYWPPIVARNRTTPEQEELQSQLLIERDALIVYEHELEMCPPPDKVGFFDRRNARNRRIEAEQKVFKQSQVVEKLEAKLNASRDLKNRPPLRVDQIKTWDDIDEYYDINCRIYYADLGNGVIWLPRVNVEDCINAKGVFVTKGTYYVGWVLTVNCNEIEVSDDFVELYRPRIKQETDLQILVDHFNANSKFVKRS